MRHVLLTAIAVLALTGCADAVPSSPAVGSPAGATNGVPSPAVGTPAAESPAVEAPAAAAPAAETPAAETPAADTPSIRTRGVGTVTGTPDTLTVVLGVATRGPGAAGALDDNNARAAALLDVLRGRGVADADLRTSQLSIYPNYTSDGGVDGYEVSNQVTAVLRDVAAAGALIDAAADAAGDAVRVQQITFSLDDDSEPRARARADAVGQAQVQAEQLAAAAGVSLGRVLSITEVTTEAPIPFAADAAAARFESAVPLAPGTQDVSVTVQVVHAIG